jgi:hypothetical protein
MRAPPPNLSPARIPSPERAGIAYRAEAIPGPAAQRPPLRRPRPCPRTVLAVDTESRFPTAGGGRCSRVPRSGWSPAARVQEPKR